ncbi:MAG: hypothetical protein EGQ31_02155 [Prevotella sp.]|nr:hypothetical protein [Prevotella sp.]
MPYNTTLYVKSGKKNGELKVVSPKNESSVTGGNKSLLFVEANWCPNVTLGVKQTSTLPTGVYKLVFDAYANTNLDNGKSLCGVKYGNLSIYKWPSELNKWTKLEIIFNVATETSVDFSMGYLKSRNAGVGSSPFLFVDNLKLYKLSETALSSTDVTSKITNPNADNDKNGWDMTGGVRKDAKGFDGKMGFFEPGSSGWSSKDGWTGYLYQTINNIPNGIYNLKSAIQSEADVISLVVANESVSEKAPANGSAKGTIKSDGSVVEAGKGVAGWNYAQTSVLVTDGTLKIGAWSAAFASSKWTNIDNFTLSYLEGSEIYVAQKLLSNKIDEAQAMIDGGEYKGTDALQAKINDAKSKLYTASISELESTKTALQVAMNNLLVSNATLDKPSPITIANPDMATKGSWTGSDNFSYATNNENPGSNVTRPYYETWVSVPNHQSDKSFNQIVKDCPAGAYELKAAVTATYQVAGNDIHNNNGVYLYIKDGEKITKTPCKTGDKAQYFSVVVNHEAEGDLEIGLQIDATTGVNWVAFDNFSLNCYGIGNFDGLVKKNYDAILATAKAITDDNVTGEEKTKLESLITATPADYVTAASDLQLATINFNEAKVSYKAFVVAKALEQTKLAYALEEKYTTFTTSKEVTPTNAADAETKANAIIAARRAYVESNGKAEGVKGAEDCTAKVVNPTFTASDGKGSLEGWNRSQSGGNEGALNGEIWTNADANKGYYYDYYNGGANNQHVYQEVANLIPGKYIVTIKARAQAGFNLYLLINDEKKVDINEIGSAGGDFERGWNDYTTEFTVGADGKVKIEVANMPSSNQAGWFGFGDVRLVRLGNLDVTLDEATDNTIEAMPANVTLKRKFVANKWNTLVLPFAVSDADVKTTFGADAKIVEYSNAEDVNINFTTSTNGIKANVPVLIMPAAVNTENTYTFNGVSIVVADPKADGTSYSFVGSYKPYDLVNDDYMLYADKWWKTETGDTYKIKAFRAYIKANTPAAAKQLNLVIDGQTTGLKLNTVNGNIEGETYNIAGQRVANSYKGLVIKNGKKIIKK